ncbi:MAG TPA: hypothetical protein DCL15_03580 [Chloroflexi bacterium]|nr:hypothetical protein [Chloroflexota bacterium]HHW87138.1 hypothetical protein [Chloroflexota bacterium]
MQSLLIGVEVGTSAVKGVLYDLTGAEHFSTRCAYHLLTPQPGWAEQDAEELWGALLTVLRETATAANALGRVVALALAAQAGSVVAVDGEGAAVAPLITWLDTRAEAIVADWTRTGRADRIRQISGWHPHPGLPLATLAWLTRHTSQVVQGAAHIVDVHSFLLYRLTGLPLTDFSEAAETLLLDRATATWSAELCALAGVQPRQLPGLLPAGAVAASLLPEVARATGLSSSTLVVVGGHDQCCAALGMGITAPGQLMLASGTAWVLTALTPDLPVAQIPPGMELNYHILPGLHTISQLLGGFGAVVTWWLSLLWPDVKDRYAALEAALTVSPPGARGLRFLPIGGSAQLGSGRGGFLGLRLDHARDDLARAVCEGIAYEVRWALDRLAASQLAAAHMWMAGGATQSNFWPQLIADVTGAPVYVAPHANWQARGAAILAGVGAGLLGADLMAAAQRWQIALAEVTPNRDHARLYAAAYADYRHLCARVADEESTGLEV